MHKRENAGIVRLQLYRRLELKEQEKAEAATTVSLIGSKWKLLIMCPSIKFMESWSLAYKEQVQGI